jgi:hypothetical protein
VSQNNTLTLSALAHTWILDFDGSLVKHNGYRNGTDEWLPGALEFLRSIPADDYILILTARESVFREQTEAFIKAAGIRYNDIKFDIPAGERILLNDEKPSGLRCAYTLSPKRDAGLVDIRILIDRKL